jgi:hypothetical protein
MNIGDTLILRGKSSHGKNRVNQFGKVWEVAEIRDRLQTTTHKGVPGPFLCIFSGSPLEDNPRDTMRWIAENNDPDFEIVE